MEQKVAMVTGASQGIGKGIALELAKAGYDIALHCSSNISAAQITAAEINALDRRCEIIQSDFSHYEGIVELFNAFDRVFDRIDILVSNAGITFGGPILETDIETFDKVNAIDWRGGFFC
ncbi:MAG: SDR family NAD(P)-dependent oxidoreductase, partial [Eubacteriales bacterium]|nr:SDR family NAD(P)-dependent oxidoreductase [Eubacteriales bacterium]